MTKSPISNDDPEINEESQNSKSETPNLDGDWVNFFVLLILFIIQGISVGLCTAFPMILQSKGMVTYDDQVSNYYLMIFVLRRNDPIEPGIKYNFDCYNT